MEFGQASSTVDATLAAPRPDGGDGNHVKMVRRFNAETSNKNKNVPRFRRQVLQLT
jgi:hypothetical protein